MGFLFERANILSKKASSYSFTKKKQLLETNLDLNWKELATYWDKGGTINLHITYPPLILGAISITLSLIKYFKKSYSRLSKIRPDLKCSSPAINKRAFCKNTKQSRQNKNTLSGLSFVLWHSDNVYIC